MKLQLQGITKRFGTFTANDQIDLVVQPGEIHALLGENGAGKSTLMNVLYGLYEPTEGTILVDDVPVTFKGPGDAMAVGIGMVHQHFMLVPVLTVAENIMLGAEHTSRGMLDLRRARKLVRELSDRHHLEVDPDAKVEDLPVGIQQRVEILKALAREAKVLILDEPTAVLTPQETDHLMEVMRSLKAQGTSLVFISHKLREVREVADTITVIRRGKVVGTAEPTATAAELAALMVGRTVQLRVEKEPAKPRDVVLDVDKLRVVDAAGQVLVDDISFSVRGGEIYAIAGVQGNGQTELTEAIVGLIEPASGRVIIDGEDVTDDTTHDILRAGVGYVPEDRAHDGLVSSFSIAENLVLDMYDQAPFGGRIQLNNKEIAKNATARVEEFDVRTTSATAPASTLSGGNQQKVVLARELSRPLRLFVVSQPTRGVDVGSMEFVHKRIVAERDRGAAVLLVSTELDEVVRPGRPDRGHVPRHHRRGAAADRVRAGVRPAHGRPARRHRRRRHEGVCVSEQKAGGEPAVSTPESGSTVDQTPDGGAGRLREVFRSDHPAILTLLAIVAAVVIGSILIIASDQATRTAASYFTAAPMDTISAAWHAVSGAYVAIFQGSILNPSSLSSGNAATIFGPISETIVSATPLIFAGLSVTLAFRAGLFNIGAQGQILLAAIFAGYVGFSWHLPVVLHVIVAVLAGILGGALWAGLAGFLKAKTGAHEVITTIMLNYVALNLIQYLLGVHGFQAKPYNQAISPPVDHNAHVSAPPRVDPAGERRVPRRDRGDRRGGVAAEPQHLRVPAAHGRRQPGRRAYGGDQHLPGLHRGHADRRRARRTRGQRPGARHLTAGHQRHRRRRRLRRDHRVAARPRVSDGHVLGGHALRRAACGIGAAARLHQHPVGPGAGPAGLDRALHRRTGTGAVDLPATPQRRRPDRRRREGMERMSHPTKFSASLRYFAGAPMKGGPR